ncbi:MAG: AsnC family transcriptional regulator [Nanoarchaeota archaeon]|nr:Lrp/AsnC family transcriptional regulator [Nanoarchaeota archaeon]MBU1030743.1 Lrp/AsnC family transcriptional regulator [Nanoarchaeota archaeon]MBU1849920.1 Lrp/AsnC family transcriptional regulator [Nanoarchaeota archaeon]
MNITDQRILLELMKNSRTPITQLAKKVNISREVATYRINQLKNKNIIKGFTAEINTEKLNFMNGSLFLSLKTKGEKELKKFINECNFASWSSEFSGAWTFGIEIYGKNSYEIDDNFKKIYKQFKEDIIDHRLLIHKTRKQFYEKFFGEKVINVKKKIQEKKIDSTDKTILKELAKDARKGTLALAKTTGLTAPAIAKRIKKLEQSNYITKYSIFLEPRCINLLNYSVFIVNKNLDDRTKLLSHLETHPNVSFLLEYVGDPFIEFGVVIKNPYELRNILQKIEESFPDNRITEVFLIQSELLSLGPPPIVFE